MPFLINHTPIIAPLRMDAPPPLLGMARTISINQPLWLPC